jgi:hypothetical protein
MCHRELGLDLNGALEKGSAAAEPVEERTFQPAL